MVSLLALWMPILASAVAVFLVSSIVHMVLKYHKSDYKKIPHESEALAGLAKAALAPGYYHFPHCDSMKEMGSPEMQDKLRRGPVGFLIMMKNGPGSMGIYLGLWFVYLLILGFVLAYLASRALPAGLEYKSVFCFIGTAAFLAHGVAPMIDSIWRSIPWSNTVRAMFDGLIYSLVTAGVFGWLWPR